MGQSIFELLCENQRLIRGSSENRVGHVGPLGSRNQDRITSAISKDKEERRASGHKKYSLREEGREGRLGRRAPHSQSVLPESLQGQ